MKSELINPFLNASINLFNKFIGVDLQSNPPYLKEDVYDLQEVSAIIGLAGETVGAVVLSFDREVAIKMVSKFSGMNHKALGREVLDGVGELVNIIAGNAKRDLHDFRIDISLPGVVTGSTCQINWPKGVPIITIPFESEVGSFSVNVSLKDKG